MNYDLRITRSADRSLAKLPRTVQERIDLAIDQLATDPRPEGSQRLTGTEPIYRIRVGDYRVLYTVDDTDKIVTVVRIGHRREVYRGL
ncbi:MAG TPA: type II toxin-antitoxin system RelE/ParE family toxin [Chloroflexota bacterium]|nr:type II toxin-antitoxin system RelE/ParE family toxin [Chloroflexota bacterium]